LANFSTVKVLYLIDKKGLDTFWATFSQTHLVTLKERFAKKVARSRFVGKVLLQSSEDRWKAETDCRQKVFVPIVSLALCLGYGYGEPIVSIDHVLVTRGHERRKMNVCGKIFFRKKSY
jgi:hypothetical protein